MRLGKMSLLIFVFFLCALQSTYAQITIDAPDTLYIDTDYSLGSFFSDTSFNDITTDYWGWRIEVINGDGNTSLIGIDSLQGLNKSSWKMSIDTIPVFHSTSIEINKKHYEFYSALLIVYTTDSNDNTYTLAKQISLIGDARDPYLPPTDPFIQVDSHDTEVYEHTILEFTAFYIDDFNTGELIAEYFNWKLFLFHTEGILMLGKADSLFAPRYFGGNRSDWVVQIDSLPSNHTYIKDSSGSIITFLTVNTTDNYNQYFSQVDLLSFVDNPTSINSLSKDEYPKNIVLSQNYPNPFNPKTTIKFELNTKSDVMITIYDISGREIKVLVDQQKSAGQHSVSFDASGLASGVYIYKLIAGSFEQSRKMLLVQ